MNAGRAEPLLPMHLFANRNAILCWCTIFFTSFQAISLIVLMPLRFQSVTGAGADSAALHLLPLAMGLPIGAYFAGRRTSITGRYKPMILGGALLMPMSILGMAFSPPQAFWLSSLFMLLCGIASGMQFPDLAGRHAELGGTAGHRRRHQHHQPVPLIGRCGGRGLDVGAVAGVAAGFEFRPSGRRFAAGRGSFGECLAGRPERHAGGGTECLAR